ncbi:hypothetical protein [Dyadobacter aurulentus]|uniref:hypothetical protein n=1 Tax=Dyadobacter sp. UC 10 TaxID=2605428 RepID=UPI0011F1CDD1|nr:hypothetical protein [Dyadobacter sp. UC 10]KAA0991860.1 hypothetical protein FXO21_17620 [Dyadobacter sp. UC 10]
MKNKIAFMLAIVSFFSCDDGWGPGGPTQARLHGQWQLDSSKTNGKLDSKPYEILDIHIKDKQHIENTFQGDSLVNVQYWSINAGPIIDDSHSTILVNYRSGLKRFYKLRFHVGNPGNLEATDYVDEVGSAMDTVKYYYTEIWR